MGAGAARFHLEMAGKEVALVLSFSGGEGKEGTRVCGLNFLINSPWPLGLGPEEAAASALGGF